MNNRVSLVALFAIFASLLPTVHANRAQIAQAMKDAAARVQKGETTTDPKELKKRAAAAAASVRTIARLQNAAGARYFSDDVKIDDAQRDFALSVGSVGFIRASEKSITVCRYDYIDGRSSLTKYEKHKKEDGIGYTLRPVKTEEYLYTFELTAFCKRKGMNARNASPLGEMTARLLRATTNQSELDCGALTSLYKNCVPTWIQADSSETVDAMIDNLREDLLEEAIDPSMTDLLVKPVVIVQIKDDLLLDSFSEQEWELLNETYNVATFQDAKLRDFFVGARQDLVTARSATKNSFNMNPSLAEKMFAEVEAASGFFSVHNIIIKTVKDVISSAKYWGVPALLVAGILYLKKPAGRAWNSALNTWDPARPGRLREQAAREAVQGAAREAALEAAATTWNAGNRNQAVQQFMAAAR